MGYDIAILVCVVFAALVVFVGLYIAFQAVRLTTESIFGDSTVLRWIFNIVFFPIMVCVVFFFLGTPIMFVLGMALQLSFHGH